MNFWAHSKNDNNEPHALYKHLNGVADLMYKMACHDNYRHTFKVAGMVHDFGKFQIEFQNYLLHGGKRGSVPHAALGAVFCKFLKQQEAAFVVCGHHKGLPNLSSLQTDIASHDPCSETFQTLRRNFLITLGVSINELELDNNFPKFTGTARELFIRYLFSALTDADWIHTESHFSPQTAKYRGICKLDTDVLLRKIEKELDTKPKDGKINDLRMNARQEVMDKAKAKPAFFSLPLPTGLGKTLTSVSWALAHALHNKMKRIIIVLPYISIIDQTATELKRIFGEESVLEHHSNLIEDLNELISEVADENVVHDTYLKRLAVENWNYPIIVTTSVQFFESLFSNKPSKCRKLHNIANSVVIFDEVQTLRKDMVLPTLGMLKDIQVVMNTTFLFCTATQPAFAKRDGFDGIENINPLVQNPQKYYEPTIRVQYHNLNELEPTTLEYLHQFIKSQNSSLICVFNTKKKAREFFKLCQENASGELLHLSTGMYPAHRKEVLVRIKSLLQAKEKVVVVATQLIEAGVDLDFPLVFREIAPLESIIQSAGRCNREGRLTSLGNVYIFRLDDDTAPDNQYRALAEYATSLYANNLNLLHQPEFFTEYYANAVKLFVDPDKFGITDARANFRFEDVAESYKVIDNNTTGLFVYCKENKELYEKLENKPVLSKTDYQIIQQYSVQVFENFIRHNFHKITISKHGYRVWYGGYNKDYGISEELSELMI